jgi:hypothetical protein
MAALAASAKYPSVASTSRDSISNHLIMRAWLGCAVEGEMVDQREPSLAPIHGESLERVKGIEPSSSAWKAACFVNQINEYLHFFRAENCLFAPKVDTLLKGRAFGTPAATTAASPMEPAFFETSPRTAERSRRWTAAHRRGVEGTRRSSATNDITTTSRPIRFVHCKSAGGPKIVRSCAVAVTCPAS